MKEEWVKIEPLRKKRKDLTIIFLFSQAIGANLDTKEKRQSFIKRYIRTAKLLEPYPLKQIEGWLKIMSYLDLKKWTLETVGKYIDYDPINVIEKHYPKDCVKIFEELIKEGVLKYNEEKGYEPNW